MTNQSNQFPLHHTLSYISPIFAFPVISFIHICYTLGRSYTLQKYEANGGIQACEESLDSKSELKGQLSLEHLFDVLNFPKKQTKILTNFCPTI